MIKRFLSFIALVSLMLLSVISCQKNPDGTPDTPDIPGEIHPVPGPLLLLTMLKAIRYSRT